MATIPPPWCQVVTGHYRESHAARMLRNFDEVPQLPVSGCPPLNMPKRAVDLNGSPDSRLRQPALHFVNMPPERFDWSDRQQPQADPSAAGLAGVAPAGLAQAAPPPAGSPQATSAVPSLVVRTRRSDHELQAGAIYRIGRDPKSDIVMTDSRVSWRHGVLRVDGTAWVLEDLGSTNGTFLGLQRVERVEISSVVVVRLGNADDGPILRCTLQPSDGAGSSPPPPPPPVASAVPAPPPVPQRPAVQERPAVHERPAPGREGRAPSAGGPESWWQPGPDAGPVSPAVGSRQPAVGSRQPAAAGPPPAAANRPAAPQAEPVRPAPPGPPASSGPPAPPGWPGGGSWHEPPGGPGPAAQVR